MLEIWCNLGCFSWNSWISLQNFWETVLNSQSCMLLTSWRLEDNQMVTCQLLSKSIRLRKIKLFIDYSPTCDPFATKSGSIANITCGQFLKMSQIVIKRRGSKNFMFHGCRVAWHSRIYARLNGWLNLQNFRNINRLRSRIWGRQNIDDTTSGKWFCRYPKNDSKFVSEKRNILSDSWCVKLVLLIAVEIALGGVTNKKRQRARQPNET